MTISREHIERAEVAIIAALSSTIKLIGIIVGLTIRVRLVFLAHIVVFIYVFIIMQSTIHMSHNVCNYHYSRDPHLIRVFHFHQTCF